MPSPVDPGAFALLLVLAACQPAPVPAEIHELRGEALGKTWLVKWHGDVPTTEPVVEAAVVRVLDEVESALSTKRPDSDLSRARAAEGPIVVREETVDVVDAALAIARATDGAFDPTVQPLMELWGFRGPRVEKIPSDAEIAVTRARVDWRKVRTGRDFEDHPTLDDGGTALDIAGLSGYAADRVSWALSDLGVFDHVVEVGGEFRVQGRSPSGSWWRLGVDLPSPEAVPGEDLAQVIEVTNGAMSSSGNYRETFEIGGVQIHHTMDPRTGRPATSRILSSTVIAPDCRTADGWATALLVLDPDEGMALVEARPDLDALLLLPDGDGYVRRMSSGMERHLVTVGQDAADAAD